MAINIPNSFTAGDTIAAAEVNANFDAVTDKFAAEVVDADIKATAAIQESKILFADAGHDHSGGTDGSTLDGDSVALATNDGTEGVIKFKSGTINVAARATSAAINFAGVAFTQVPLIMVTYDGGGALNETTLGMGGYYILGAALYGYYIQDLTNVSFKINNKFTDAQDFNYVAIGI